MRHVFSFWQGIFILSLWCMAVAGWFVLSGNLQNGYKTLREIVFKQDLLYEETKENEEGKAKIVSRNELIGSLVTGLSYDVEIDGELLEKEKFVYTYFDFGKLARSYTKTYLCEKGEDTILKICYSRRKE